MDRITISLRRFHEIERIFDRHFMAVWNPKETDTSQPSSVVSTDRLKLPSFAASTASRIDCFGFEGPVLADIQIHAPTATNLVFRNPS